MLIIMSDRRYPRCVCSHCKSDFYGPKAFFYWLGHVTAAHPNTLRPLSCGLGG